METKTTTHPAERFLDETAFDTNISNREFLELVKESTDLMELERRWDIPARSIRQHAAKVSTAMTIVANRNSQQTSQKQCESVLACYRRNNYSIREVQKQLNIPFPKIRNLLREGFSLEGHVIIRGDDWNAGKKDRVVFELFKWMKMAHKHFSLRVFCDTIGWSPKAVIDLVHQCNDAGYAVIMPRITGEQHEWLKSYMEGDESYHEASKNKPIPKRGGKEIFKRLLHQENPGRRTVNLPSKNRKKRNSPGAKRGLVNSRGGKVKHARKIWGNISGEMRAGMQQYLNSLR